MVLLLNFNENCPYSKKICHEKREAHEVQCDILIFIYFFVIFAHFVAEGWLWLVRIDIECRHAVRYMRNDNKARREDMKVRVNQEQQENTP